MWTIVDEITGLVLFAKSDSECLEGQIAINEICRLETTEPVYWNFENEIFYTKWATTIT